MIDIQTALYNILHGRYGRDVRQSIHDGMYQINEAAQKTNAISDVWTSRTYSAGEYCIYNNTLYRCKASCTNVLPTNTTYWESTKVGTELSNVKSASDYYDISSQYTSYITFNNDVDVLNCIAFRNINTAKIFFTITKSSFNLGECVIGHVNNVIGMTVFGSGYATSKVSSIRTFPATIMAINNGELRAYLNEESTRICGYIELYI